MMQPALPSSFTAVLAPRRRLNCAETAKLVRKALKEAFPEIKFSVRSSTYAGGASISVRWSDGPLMRQVDPIIGVFAGAGFDGMRDLKTYKTQTMDGASFSFGADYVQGQREVTKARIDAIEALLLKTPRDYWLTVAVEMGDPSPCSTDQHAHNDARYFAWMLLTNCGGEAYEGRRSATADSVLLVDDDRNDTL